MTVTYLLFVMIMYATTALSHGTEVAGLGVCLCVLLLIGVFIYGVYFKTLEKVRRQLGIR